MSELHCATRDPAAFFLRKTLILRPPVCTPRTNIRINASMMVTAAATGKIGTYRKNAPRLPRIRTPRRTPAAVIRWFATPLTKARAVPIPARFEPAGSGDFQRCKREDANIFDINGMHAGITRIAGASSDFCNMIPTTKI